MSILLKRKEILHTMVSATEASSATLQIWQHGVKNEYCDFANVNIIFHTRKSISIFKKVKRYIIYSSVKHLVMVDLIMKSEFK